MNGLYGLPVSWTEYLSWNLPWNKLFSEWIFLIIIDKYVGNLSKNNAKSLLKGDDKIYTPKRYSIYQ